MTAGPRATGLRQIGFTLIELLVVMVLIGVIAGLATLAIGDGADRELRQEAQRLAGVLRLAHDELLITGGADRALGLRREGYSLLDLVLLDDATREWQALQDPQLGPHYFNEGVVELEYEADGTRQGLPLNESWKPHVRLSNTGEMTPGLITLRVPGKELVQYINIGLEGSLEVTNERP
ncbi:general secretion pathway protein H [Halopseudomonas sabulinigri]|uniref:General secretion pathway protein H n=1 Tax=Halopseudomonas sabulinigri TaxID=472181 RepID=A0A1H1XP26_9GAMM|nr:prepilin-type N-terminal cleavage/methylation domain-containing protein [Halopseudomonas sabulinigri]SDT10998.1 general secretion pathway protein H [Halopseudomonas sabulinigri]